MPTSDDPNASNSQATERLRDIVARLSADDINRDLGGGWTVGFALAHLAFWDARQVAALQRMSLGEPFPAEDMATNAALEHIAAAFNPATIGDAAVHAAEQLDAAVAQLSADQLQSLSNAGLSYAVERAPHRDEHRLQIETLLG